MNKDDIIKQLIGNTADFKVDSEYITIAQLKTDDKNGLRETIDVNTSLISKNLAGRIKSSHVNPFVNKSSVNYDKDYIYNPSFWLYISPSSGLKKTEPLVVSWCSGNHTTFCIDQGFLSTFELSPRLLNEEILWDDLKRPIYEVVKNKLLSVYEFPNQTEAFVKIKKEYIEDYLFLRKKTAIQIYTIQRDILVDDNILQLFNERGFYVEEFDKYEIRIHMLEHKDGIARLEINGYKLLFDPTDSLNSESDTPIGHYWKGINGLVTNWRARHEMPFQYVYVSDCVLARYEKDDDFDVYPLSGGVNYKQQWNVSYCQRIGQNAIKIEIKKLYEGTPYDVIEYWNQFSILAEDIIEGENIAIKAERLTRKYFLFSRLFSGLINRLFCFDLLPTDIITLNEIRIEYTGWSDFPDYKPITHHLNLNDFSKEQFVSRCKKLYILLGENLREKTLRKIVDYLGFSTTETKNLRSLKLLELIIKYLSVAHESGLNSTVHKETIIERVTELKEFNAFLELFALNDIRQLDAHKGDNTNMKFNNALKSFEIQPNSISNNYANACKQVYDSLDGMFLDINIFLSEYNA